MRLQDLPWDFWDKTKPTLWQVVYLQQLQEQTHVVVEPEETREQYKLAIADLLVIRHQQRRLQLQT